MVGFTFSSSLALLPSFQILPGEQCRGEYDEESEERDNDDDWKELHVVGQRVVGQRSEDNLVSVHIKDDFYATRTMQGRRRFIGTVQILHRLRRGIELNFQE